MGDMTNILYQDMSNLIFRIIIRHIVFTLAGEKKFNYRRSSLPEQKCTDNVLTPLPSNMFMSVFLQS